MHLLSTSFFFHSYGDHRDLHSFPTRRSSDLFSSSSTSRTQTSSQKRSGFDLTICAESRPRACTRTWSPSGLQGRSEEHTSELQSRGHLVCRLLLEKKKEKDNLQAGRLRTDQV